MNIQQIFLCILTLSITIGQEDAQLLQCLRQQYSDELNNCNSCSQAECLQCTQDICIQCSTALTQSSIISEQCLKTNQQCSNGYFLNQITQRCEKCRIPGCSSCQTSTQCGVCSDGFQKNSQTQNCIFSKLIDQNTQAKSIVFEDNRVEIVYQCPFKYEEIKDDSACSKLMQCSAQISDQDLFFQDEIKELILFNNQIQIIAISSKQVAIYDRESLTLDISILNLSQVQDNSQASDEEIIHNVIIVKNVMNILSSARIYCFDLVNEQFVYNLDFIQSGYEFSLKQRYHLNEEDKTIRYLYLEDSLLILKVAQFQLSFTTSENGDIIGQSYRIAQVNKIQLQMIHSIFQYIAYIQEMKIIFIAAQNQFYSIYVDNLIQDNITYFKEVEEELQNSEIPSRYIAKSNQGEELQYQFGFSDSSGQQYLISKINSDYQLQSITIQQNTMQIQSTLILYDLPITSLTIQQCFSSSYCIQFGQVLLISLHVSQNEGEQNQPNSTTIQLKISSIDQSKLKSFQIDNRINLYFNISDTFLMENERRNNIILLIVSNEWLYVLELINNVFTLQLAIPLNPLYSTSFSQNTVFKTSIDKLSSFDIVLSSYTNTLILRFQNNQIKLLQSEQQPFSSLEDIYSLPLNLQKQSSEQLATVDKMMNQIFLIDYSKSLQSLIIYKIDIESNQIIGFYIYRMDQSCLLPCLNYSMADSSLNVLLIMTNQIIYSFDYFSLQLISTFQYQTIFHFQHPYLIVLDNKNKTHVLEVKQYGILNTLYSRINQIYQTDYLLRVNKENNWLLFSFTIDFVSYNLVVFYKGQQLSQQVFEFDDIQHVEIYNDLEFIVIYINQEFYEFRVIHFRIEIAIQEVIVVKQYDFLGQRDWFNDQHILVISDTLKAFILVYQLDINYFLILSMEDYSIKYIILEMKHQNLLQKIGYHSATNKLYLLYRGKDSFGEESRKLTMSVYSTLLETQEIFNANVSTLNILFQENDQYTFSSNTKMQSLFGFVGQYFQQLTLMHKNKQTLSKLNFLEKQNTIYFNDGQNSMIIKNIPSQYSLSFVQDIFTFKWFMIDSYGFILLVQKNMFLQQTKLEIRLLDTLEIAFEQFLFDFLDDFFWFQKQETLVVVSQSPIKFTHYQLINNKLEVTHVSNANAVISNMECIQTEMNSLLICHQFGIYNMESKAIAYDGSLLITPENRNIIQENIRYVLFGYGKIYDIQENTIQDIKAEFFISFLPIVEYFQLNYLTETQGLFLSNTECIIFNLPSFSILLSYPYSLSIDILNTSTCLLSKNLNQFFVFHNFIATIYSFPLSQNSNQQVMLQKKLDFSYQRYFNFLLTYVDKLIVGQTTKLFNNQDFYCSFLILDTITGEVREVDGFVTDKYRQIVQDLWLEKNLLITDEQYIGIGDVKIAINMAETVMQSQTKRELSKIFNYIVYQQNMNQFASLDVSELLPMNSNNSIPTARYLIASTNIFNSYDIKQNNNGQKYIATGHLIRFDLRKYQLVKSYYYLLQSDITTPILQIQQKTILADLSQFYHNIMIIHKNYLKNHKSPYKLYIFSERDQNDLKVYALVYNCQLIVIVNNQSLIRYQDLLQFQCNIIEGNNSFSLQSSHIAGKNSMISEQKQKKYYLIQNFNILLEIVYENKDIEKIEIYKEQEEEKKIKTVITVDNEDKSATYLCLLYYQPTNVIQLLYQSQDVSISQEILVSDSTKINALEFITIKSFFYIAIGSDTNIVIYDIKVNAQYQQLDIQEVAKFKLGKRGEARIIQQMKDRSLNEQIVLQLIITSSYRIMIFDCSFLQDVFQFTLKRENIIHTRQLHTLKVLQGNQIISVFSQLQVSFYAFPTLQYIARIEEQTSKSITDIHSVIYQNEITIVVCDYDEIQIFYLKRLNSQKKLILQKQYPLQYPQIYSIVHSSELSSQVIDDHQIIINGAHLTGSFSINLMSSDPPVVEDLANQSNQNGNCVFNMYLPNKQIEQERFYLEFLQNQKQVSQNIQHFSFEFEKSKDLFIPRYLLNSKQVTSQQVFDIQVNLMQFKSYLITHQERRNYSYVKQLKIFNGLIVIEDVLLFKIDTIVFKDVILKFATNQAKLVIEEVSTLVFESVIIDLEEILNDERIGEIMQNKQLTLNSLISIKNCQNVLIRKVQIRNSKMQSDILLFENTENVRVEIFSVVKCDILGTILYFLANNTSISISQVQMRDSSILQAISITDTHILSIDQLTLSSVLNYSQLEDIIAIQQRVLNSDLQDNPFAYTYNSRVLNSIENYSQNIISFIFIRYIRKEAILNSIRIINKCLFSVFLDFSYVFKQSDGNLEMQSIDSQVRISDLFVQNSEFIQHLIKAEQYDLQLLSLRIKSSRNALIEVIDAKKRLIISNVVIYQCYYQNAIFQIIMSVVNIQNVILQSNSLISPSNDELYAIQIINCIFYINNFKATDNISPSYLMLIKTQLQESDTDLSKNTFLHESQRNLIINLEIERCNKGGLIVRDIKQMSIVSSKFIQNSRDRTTLRGGAISFINTNLCKIISSTISSNFAILYGGGIYLQDSDLLLKGSIITQNQALIGGGVRYFNEFKPIYFLSSELAVQVFDNSASMFGKDYGSLPHTIKLVNNLQYITSSLSQISTTLIFKVYDETGSLINYNYAHIQDDIHLSLEDQQELDNYKSYSLISDETQLLIEKQSILYDPLLSQFNITCYLINSGYQQLQQSALLSSQEEILKNKLEVQFKYLQLDLNLKYSSPIYLQIRFRDCLKGELIQQLQYNTYQCFLCDQNTYSIADPLINFEYQKCNQCPYGSSYCIGNKIVPKEEYWIDPGTDYIAYCLNSPHKCTQKYMSNQNNSDNNEINYLNSETVSNGCIEGGYGVLCQSCDYRNEFWGRDERVRYAKANKYECMRCEDDTQYSINNYILNIVLISLFLFFLSYQIINHFNCQLNNLKANLLKKLSIILLSNSLNQSLLFTSVWKILISYLQIISIVAYFQLKTHEELYSVLFFLGNILEISFYLFDCALVSVSKYVDIKMIYLRLIYTLLSPFLYAALLLFIGGIVVKIKKIHKSRLRNLITSSILQLYFMIYTGLVSQTIGTITCLKINSKYYILLDTQFVCFDSQYYFYNLFISLPLLLLTILFPLFIFAQIKRTRSRQSQSNQIIGNYLKYGFFYSDYSDKKYYWEICKMYQKIFIYFIVAIFNQQSIVMGIIISLSIIIYFKFQQQEQPYRRIQLNQLDQLSQITALVTIFSYMVTSQSHSYVLQILFLIAIIASNLILLVQIALVLFVGHKCREKLQNLFSSISFLKSTTIENSIISLRKRNNLYRVTKNWKVIEAFIKSKRILNQKIYLEENTSKQNFNKQFLQKINKNSNQNLTMKDDNQILNDQIPTICIFSQSLKTPQKTRIELQRYQNSNNQLNEEDEEQSK